MTANRETWDPLRVMVVEPVSHTKLVGTLAVRNPDGHRRHKPHRSNRGAVGWADDRLATREGAADACEDVGCRPWTVQGARALLGL